MNPIFTRRQFCGMLAATALSIKTADAGNVCIQAASQFCLPQPATRVITLDGRHVENLLATGLQPVGVASADAYRRLMHDAVPVLDNRVQDIGLVATPNIEKMMALEPHLIIGNDRSVQKNHAILTAIAPVAVFDPYPKGSNDLLANMFDTFVKIAQLTGRQAQAAAYMQHFEQQLAVAKDKLAKAGWAGRRVVLGNINTGITGADMMLFNSNALPACILTRLGLQYAYDLPQFKDKSFNVTTVEALTTLQDIDFLYMPFNEAGVRKLVTTPVWRNLRFVKDNRLHSVAYHEMYGGPLVASLFVQDIVKALLS